MTLHSSPKWGKLHLLLLHNIGMNTYHKFAPNVFVAKCDSRHVKDEVIDLSTKHGKTHECIVWNFLGQTRDGHFLYSITRADGTTHQSRMQAKAGRRAEWAASAERKANEWWKKSQEGKDFLALAEPIKIGHHSEKRHRALIDSNWNRMGNSVAQQRKAEEHNAKADYWEGRASEINLSMPESLEYYEFELEKARMHHEGLKAGTIKRQHSFDVPYANKAVKVAKERYDLAVRLWATDEERGAVQP
jgi:hypothetical protein